MNRRGFLGGLLVSLAAPAIIRTPGLLMPVRKFRFSTEQKFSLTPGSVNYASMRIEGSRDGIHWWDVDSSAITVQSGAILISAGRSFPHWRVSTPYLSQGAA
jgi:hypothetical protein